MPDASTLAGVWRAAGRRVPGDGAVSTLGVRRGQRRLRAHGRRRRATATKSPFCRLSPAVTRSCSPLSSASRQHLHEIDPLMFDKLNAVEARYGELTSLLADPAVQTDAGEVPRARQGALGDRAAGREIPRVQARRSAAARRAGARARAATPRWRALAQEELKDLEPRHEALLGRFKILLLPKDPERREERAARDPRRHGRRRSGPLCGRAVPHVQPLRRAPGLEARGHVAERHRRRRHQGSHRVDRRQAASTAG